MVKTMLLSFYCACKILLSIVTYSKTSCGALTWLASWYVTESVSEARRRPPILSAMIYLAKWMVWRPTAVTDWATLLSYRGNDPLPWRPYKVFRYALAHASMALACFAWRSSWFLLSGSVSALACSLRATARAFPIRRSFFHCLTRRASMDSDD